MNGPDSDDMKLVTIASRRARDAGASQEAAFQQALTAYLERYPETPSDRAGEIVAELLGRSRRSAGARTYARRGH